MVPDPAVRTELDKLQGTWQVVAIQSAGAKLPQDQVKGEYHFNGRALTVRHPDRADQVGEVTVDPGFSPPHLTIFYRGPFPPVPAIYRITGDELQLCLVVDQRTFHGYPPGFVSQADPKTDLLTLRRAPPKRIEGR